MTLGLYKVGENQPIIRIRRAGWSAVHPHHFLPDVGDTPRGGTTLCGTGPLGYEFEWNDNGDSCKRCLAQMRDMLASGVLILASPAVVAEFERTRLANLGDRQAAAAARTQPEPRLAVEIYRPREDVMGSVGTRREIHLVDCFMVGTVERPMVKLPVSEVRRQMNADGRRTSFCPECKPSYVLDNERTRPVSKADANKRSGTLGYIARQEAVRAGVKPIKDTSGGIAFNGASAAAAEAWDAMGRPSQAALALGGLPYDGSVHFPECPAEPDALLNGDTTRTNYGRCTCYELNDAEKKRGQQLASADWQQYRAGLSAKRPGRHGRRVVEAPDWTIG